MRKLFIKPLGMRYLNRDNIHPHEQTENEHRQSDGPKRRRSSWQLLSEYSTEGL